MKTKHLENKLKYSPSLKLLIPKDVTVTSDMRHGDKWINQEKEYERSTFRELSEIHFQMNAKRFGPIEEIYTRTGVKDKVKFGYGHLDGGLDFDPLKSTPGKRRIDPTDPKLSITRQLLFPVSFPVEKNYFILLTMPPSDKSLKSTLVSYNKNLGIFRK
ncbi:unnamed protein product [Mytilus edulis]|uniref:Uncharacterized protein n=1 Tax=Mytilus edulis TaxID=6550 RepID=A0A8S3SPJ9_MYTED|nr:unnamed protein product [Mytilus edulis]